MTVAVKLWLRVLPLAINSLYCWLAAFPGGCCFVHSEIVAVRSCHPDNTSFKRRVLFHRYPFVTVAPRFLQNGKLIFLTTSETLGIQDMRSCVWQSFSSLEWAFVELQFFLSTSNFSLHIHTLPPICLFPWILEEIGSGRNTQWKWSWFES